jgi:hypothetical protein
LLGTEARFGKALRKKRPYLAANLDQAILHQDSLTSHQIFSQIVPFSYLELYSSLPVLVPVNHRTAVYGEMV